MRIIHREFIHNIVRIFGKKIWISTLKRGIINENKVAMLME